MAGLNLPALNPEVSAASTYAADPRLAKREALTQQQMLEASRAFEAHYIYQLMELMAPEVGEGGLTGGGYGEEMWRPKLHEAVADQVAKQGSLGIGQHVLRELQEAQNRMNGPTTGAAQASAAYQQTVTH